MGSKPFNQLKSIVVNSWHLTEGMDFGERLLEMFPCRIVKQKFKRFFLNNEIRTCR